MSAICKSRVVLVCESTHLQAQWQDKAGLIIGGLVSPLRLAPVRCLGDGSEQRRRNCHHHRDGAAAVRQEHGPLKHRNGIDVNAPVCQSEVVIGSESANRVSYKGNVVRKGRANTWFGWMMG